MTTLDERPEIVTSNERPGRLDDGLERPSTRAFEGLALQRADPVPPMRVAVCECVLASQDVAPKK